MSEQQYAPRTDPAFLPSKALNFFVSLVPGAGHMYQGLMQRGTILMGLFAGSIALASFFGSFNLLPWSIRDLLIGVSVVCFIIVYFYSFFDSMRTCRLIRSGMWMADKADALDTALALPKIDFGKRGRAIAGAVMTAIGILGLSSFIINYYIPRDIVERFVRPGIEMLVPLALLVAGVVLLIKGGKAKAADT